MEGEKIVLHILVPVASGKRRNNTIPIIYT